MSTENATTDTPVEPIVNQTLPVDDGWKVEPDYLCRACGNVARLHLKTNHIWGCLQCGTTTASVALAFMPAIEFDYPAAARALALWLSEFCEETMPYPAMIAEASRRAHAEIQRLRESG
jgi:hypothetical protein